MLGGFQDRHQKDLMHKVIDSRSDGMYYYFVLDNGEERKYPVYFLTSAFLMNPELYKELQDLLNQVPLKKFECLGCKKEILIRFHNDAEQLCNNCYVVRIFDEEIIEALEK